MEQTRLYSEYRSNNRGVSRVLNLFPNENDSAASMGSPSPSSMTTGRAHWRYFGIDVPSGYPDEGGWIEVSTPSGISLEWQANDTRSTYLTCLVRTSSER